MKKKALPKYAVLESQLRKEFSRQPIGQKILPVRALMEKHQVSMATVTHALGNLARDGLITRSLGRGTFTSRPTHSKKNGQQIIGLMVPTINNSFFGRILHKLSDYLADQNWHILVRPVGEEPGNLPQHLDQLEKAGAKGLIYIPVRAESQDEFYAINRGVVEKFLSKTGPVVILDQDLALKGVPCVRSNHEAGACLVADHLALLGHRHIAFAQSGFSPSAELRWIAFEQRARTKGLNPVRICHPGELIDLPAIKAAGDRIQQIKPRISALFGSCDLVAYNLLFEFQRRGFNVPKDLSIVGFDNIDFARFSDPPLTTVNQPLEEIAERAGELLLRQIENPKARVKSLVLPVNLIERSSTTPIVRT
jgi:LacI family repressor for deo operon, udp, cdd, tsx, nupC, and nupG